MGKQWKATGKLEQASKKGALFTRLSREIQVAVRLGGAQPESNHRLQLAVSTARAQSMPKNTIERAIAKGSGQKEGEIEELLYEGFGPHGVAIMLRCLTDNRTRTVSEIRHLFKVYEGQMGSSGSVLWMFDKVALVEAKLLPEATKGVNNVDYAEEAALEVGAEDLRQEEDIFCFYGQIGDLQKIQEGLEKKSWTVFKAELAYKAKSFVSVGEDDGEKVVELLTALENNPACQSVYTNFQLR